MFVIYTSSIRCTMQVDLCGCVAANRELRCDFFEGVVMKRAESIYPVQLRSATEEYPRWVKHRFLT